jgi:transposase InsO family protein
MAGLFDAAMDLTPCRRRRRVPDAVLEELQRLKGLYDGFQYKELARIILHKLASHIGDHTVKRLGQQLSMTSQLQLPRLDYHHYAERPQARLQVMQLSLQGWSKRSISRLMRVSRPTINAWIGRFERDNLASLEDKSRAPKTPSRKAWLPVMTEGYQRQKRPPDAGGFRMWSLRGTTAIAVRTGERVMALHRPLYDDIPHSGKKRTPQTAPPPHPFKATMAHAYWFIDGRMMDVALEGVRWWSLIILDGSSRTMLAGAVAPSEASGVALMVLSTACLRSGAPEHLLADSGGAFTSGEFEAVCDRLGIDHETIVSTQGHSYMHLLETHCNIQRRIYDYQCALTKTALEFEQAHQSFIEL